MTRLRTNPTRCSCPSSRTWLHLSCHRATTRSAACTASWSLTNSPLLPSEASLIVSRRPAICYATAPLSNRCALMLTREYRAIALLDYDDRSYNNHSDPNNQRNAPRKPKHAALELAHVSRKCAERF